MRVVFLDGVSALQPSHLPASAFPAFHTVDLALADSATLVNQLEKARSRPDLVRQTLDKTQRDGVLTTLDAVRNRLDRGEPVNLVGGQG